MKIPRSLETRRSFLISSGSLIGLAALSSPLLLPGCLEKEEKAGEVTATEDLMREHGVLQRLLLIFADLEGRLQQNRDLPREVLVDTACLVRSFIQDYHEKLEEDYVFPRFEKGGKMVELVQTLRRQHEAGRKIIDFLQSPLEAMAPQNRAKTVAYIQAFARMYRPHAAREDTVLFPAFRSVVSPKEFLELGDIFEDQETRFGKDGYAKIVAQVTGYEKMLGIEDLAQFTPQV
ncbi:MAG: hemerythrin domain-containing protein [Desulfobaccales bacterium]